MEAKIKELAQEYNVEESLIKATMSDGFALDVIADWLSSNGDLRHLEFCEREVTNWWN